MHTCNFSGVRIQLSAGFSPTQSLDSRLSVLAFFRELPSRRNTSRSCPALAIARKCKSRSNPLPHQGNSEHSLRMTTSLISSFSSSSRRRRMPVLPQQQRQQHQQRWRWRRPHLDRGSRLLVQPAPHPLFQLVSGDEHRQGVGKLSIQSEAPPLPLLSFFLSFSSCSATQKGHRTVIRNRCRLLLKILNQFVCHFVKTSSNNDSS